MKTETLGSIADVSMILTPIVSQETNSFGSHQRALYSSSIPAAWVTHASISQQRRERWQKQEARKVRKENKQQYREKEKRTKGR